MVADTGLVEKVEEKMGRATDALRKKTSGMTAGAALLASMAAATTAYLYVGKNAPQRRKKTAAWMRSAEKEIVTEAKKLTKVAFSEANYKKLVEAVAERYRYVKNVSPDDMAVFIRTMADKWEKAGKTMEAVGVAKTVRSAKKKGKTSSKR